MQPNTKAPDRTPNRDDKIRKENEERDPEQQVEADDNTFGILDEGDCCDCDD